MITAPFRFAHTRDSAPAHGRRAIRPNPPGSPHRVRCPDRPSGEPGGQLRGNSPARDTCNKLDQPDKALGTG
jgi:hypothetical protein